MRRNRDSKLASALAEQAERRKAAKARRKTRVRKQRPWKAIHQEWIEETMRVFGKDVKPQAWGPAEPKLARKLLAAEEKGGEGLTVEQVIEMVHRFIGWHRDRNREGLPSFKLFWSMRGSIRALTEGKISDLDTRQVRESEYDEKAEHKGGDFDWGI